MKKLAITLSFCVGLLSLSQEICWIRIVSFGQQTRPHAFSLVLIAFLVGIAAGSIVGRQICARSGRILAAAALTLLIASAFDFTSLYLMGSTDLGLTLGSPRRMLAVLFLIGTSAALKGVLFPIVHHLGTTDTANRVGRSVSRVYVANVAGSTLGPVLTGFVLLDVMTVEQVFALIGLGTAVLALIASRYDAGAFNVRVAAPVAMIAIGSLMIFRPPGVIEAITYSETKGALKYLAQNRHGVIHLIEEEEAGRGDVTYGGNAYDGRIITNMAVNSNGLDRAYLVEAMRPHSKSSLVVGASTGAWTAVIRGLPDMASVDVVEINKGYLDVIRRYPAVAPLLTDEQIHVHIDDARRWLKANPDARYDLIFQNTTWHWRSYSTLLLSKEYCQELSGHLLPSGVIAVNTTNSLDVYKTAMAVFPHVARYKSFVYMSFAELRKSPEAEAALRGSKIWGTPAFADDQFAPNGLAHELAYAPLESGEQFLAHAKGAEHAQVISDLNLMTEYRHGAPPPFLWLKHVLPKD